MQVLAEHKSAHNVREVLHWLAGTRRDPIAKRALRNLATMEECLTRSQKFFHLLNGVLGFQQTDW